MGSYSGRRAFSADTIRHFEQAGFYYHSWRGIQKNPQAQAIRTHSKGLLFAQLNRDSAAMWQAWADFLLVFRAPGQNETRLLVCVRVCPALVRRPHTYRIPDTPVRIAPMFVRALQFLPMPEGRGFLGASW